MSGVSGDTWTLLAWNSKTPTTTPTTISKQDSGKILLSLGVMWKPARTMVTFEEKRNSRKLAPPLTLSLPPGLFTTDHILLKIIRTIATLLGPKLAVLKVLN